MFLKNVELVPIDSVSYDGPLRDLLDHISEGDSIDDVCAVYEAAGISGKQVLDGLGTLAGNGHIDVLWQPMSPDLETLRGGGEEARLLCGRDHQWWNTFAYEREWLEFPEFNDFLDPGSPVHNRKKYQWEIYERLLRREMSGLVMGSRVLDVGGGVGRAAVPLVRRGCDVLVVDASWTALKVAWKHLAEASPGSYDIAWADVGKLDFLCGKTYDAAVAFEVLCYLRSPGVALRGIVDRVKPGGWVAFSMENKLGAALADPALKGYDLLKLLGDDRVQIEEELYVRYFSKEELRKMAAEAGLSRVRIVGCHYIADGPFNKAVSESKLSKRTIRTRLRAMESVFSMSPVTRNLARAWLVVGVKD